MLVPKGFLTISSKNPELAAKIHAQQYFLKNDDIAALERIDVLLPVLVRCNLGRFTCAVRDALHFCDIIDAEGSDYVRDVALIAA